MAMMMYALWRLLKGLERLTGLTLDEIMHQAGTKPAEGGGAKPAVEPTPEKTEAD
jgi:hypothetical protein